MTGQKGARSSFSSTCDLVTAPSVRLQKDCSSWCYSQHRHSQCATQHTQSCRHGRRTRKENILEGKKSSPRYREGLYLGCPTFQLLIALNILITHGTSPWLSPGPAVNFHLQWTFYEPISQTEFLPAIMWSIGRQFSWKITWPERSNLKQSVHVSACVIHGTAAPTTVLGQTLSCQLALILPRLSGFPQIIKES